MIETMQTENRWVYQSKRRSPTDRRRFLSSLSLAPLPLKVSPSGSTERLPAPLPAVFRQLCRGPVLTTHVISPWTSNLCWKQTSTSVSDWHNLHVEDHYRWWELGLLLWPRDQTAHATSRDCSVQARSRHIRSRVKAEAFFFVHL